MKTAKKLFAILLAVVLVMALTVTAFATEPETPAEPAADANPNEATTYAGAVTITVELPDDADEDETTDETYTAYFILNVEKNAAGTAVSYWLPTDDTGWLPVLKAAPLASHFTFTDSEEGNRTYVALAEGDSISGEALADLLLANKGSLTGTPLQVGDNTVTAGYYLITSSLGSNLVLATADFSVTEKNDYPTVEKKVDKADAQIGDTLTYTLTVTIPASAVGPIVLHDTLSAGVDFDEAGDVGSFSAVANQAFTVTLDAATVAANLGGTVEVTYTGILNTSAVIGQKSGSVIDSTSGETYASDGNFNEVYLTYSNFQTVVKGVDTDTFEANILKVDADDNTLPLEGAKFTVARGETAVKFTLTNGVYVVDPAGTVEEVESGEDGTIKIQGLASETYTLTETVAPQGYNLASTTISLTINEDGSVEGANEAGSLEIGNNTGTLLPSTGGIGTTIFYILGGLLVVGAGVILVAKKRVTE